MRFVFSTDKFREPEGDDKTLIAVYRGTKHDQIAPHEGNMRIMGFWPDGLSLTGKVIKVVDTKVMRQFDFICSGGKYLSRYYKDVKDVEEMGLDIDRINGRTIDTLEIVTIVYFVVE